VGVTQRLDELGIELVAPRAPVANYVGTKRSGDQLDVSARVSDLRGQVGGDVTGDEAYEAARDTVILLLAIIAADIGSLDEIVSIDKVLGFVRAAPDFVEIPRVIDGASDLVVAVFGEAGRHARTATGVAQLPYGAAVQLEMTVRLSEVSRDRRDLSAR
jgi:enamine deaminase RidA (YjgF/YER057c/UK114 family)